MIITFVGLWSSFVPPFCKTATDVQLSERLASLGIMGDDWGAPETPTTSQHYVIEVLKMGALKWPPLCRDACVADSRCEFFFSQEKKVSDALLRICFRSEKGKILFVFGFSYCDDMKQNIKYRKHDKLISANYILMALHQHPYFCIPFSCNERIYLYILYWIIKPTATNMLQSINIDLH